jgi:hypothetical protein
MKDLLSSVGSEVDAEIANEKASAIVTEEKAEKSEPKTEKKTLPDVELGLIKVKNKDGKTTGYNYAVKNLEAFEGHKKALAVLQDIDGAKCEGKFVMNEDTKKKSWVADEKQKSEIYAKIKKAGLSYPGMSADKKKPVPPPAFKAEHFEFECAKAPKKWMTLGPNVQNYVGKYAKITLETISRVGKKDVKVKEEAIWKIAYVDNEYALIVDVTSEEQTTARFIDLDMLNAKKIWVSPTTVPGAEEDRSKVLGTMLMIQPENRNGNTDAAQISA